MSLAIYRRPLRAASFEPDVVVAQPLPELPIAIDPQLLREAEVWNDTALDFPLDCCVPQLFEEQVARTPDAVAVVFHGPPTTDHRPPTDNIQDEETRRQGDKEIQGRRTDNGSVFSVQHSAFSVQHVTYAELNQRANRLARFLIAHGTAPEGIVALLAERSIDFLTAILAVFKAGGAYLPLDPHHPPKRLGQVLAQSRAPLVLTTAAYLPALDQALEALDPADAPRCLLIANGAESAHPAHDLLPQAEPDGLAYVIFTSGSTGLPKGAMVEHKGMLNHLYAKIVDLRLTGRDRIVQNASQCFDISVWQFLAALLVGGQVHIFADETARDPARLIAETQRAQISVLEVVPSMLRALLEQMSASGERPAFEALRWLLLTGEALPPALARQWLLAYPAVPIVNAYGPTECSDDVTHEVIAAPPSADTVRVPIGVAVANMRLYVLSADREQLRLCAAGESGELYVAGVGVGRGYLNDPERTAKAFFRDPFSDDPTARLYRTGDLVRRLPDGAIEYLDRVDRQVKLRGFRIELGEIEAVLLRHEGVKDCVVVVHSTPRHQGKLVARQNLAETEPQAGEHKRLVAYVVPTREQGTGNREQEGAGLSTASLSPVTCHLSPGELRSFLAERLPNYMIPEQFVQLDALPLNANGKVDLKALPKPDNLRPELGQSFVAPRDASEQLVAQIWQDVLGIDRVGAQDNFFALGGDSLLAMQIISRVQQEAGAQLSFQRFFSAPTVAQVAQALQEVRPEPAMDVLAIPAAARPARYPLSLEQERLWFLWELEPDNPYYTFQGILHLHGKLGIPLFKRAWQILLERHAILRARFGVADGEPYQTFVDGQSHGLPLIDLGRLPEAERQERLQTRASVEAEQPFDLREDAPLRACLFRLGEEEYAVLLTMHEIILDGWATCVMVRELSAIYRDLLEQRPAGEEPVEVDFRDYVLWQRQHMRRDALQVHAEYWRRTLDGELPVLTLASDRPRPSTPSYRGGAKGVLLDAWLSQALRALSKRQEATLFMTLLAAYNLLLHIYSGQDDLIVGAPLANRTRKETEEIVGFFLNMLPLRTSLAGNPRFTELLDRVRGTVTGALTHADYPFAWMLEDINVVRDTSFAPVYQVMFNMLSFPHVSLQFDDLEVAFRELETGYTKYDLSLYAQEHGEQIYLQLSYLTDLFDEASIDRLMSNFVALLEQIVAHPDRPLSALNLLSEAERRLVLDEFNATDHAYAEEATIQQLFERQAATTPDQPALIFAGQTLSYAELNARANQLAHHLRALGVGPEVRVGLCVERSFLTLVGILGILKAGGAYVALDPTYPQARLNEILEDTQAPVLVLQPSLDQFDGYHGRKVALDQDYGAIAHECTLNPASLSRPDNLLHVVYTSASTGRPKGVQVLLGSVLNRLHWMWHAYPFQPGDVAVLQKSYALVASTWECFGGLLKGIPTVILSRQQQLDPAELWQELVSQRVSYLLASPALLNGILDQAALHPGEWQALRLATSGAEALPPALVERWRGSFPHVPLLNLYGSTECSSNAAIYDTSALPAGASHVPVGKPLDNVRLYVVDRYLRPVPIGVPGELCVAGACVARGYLNRPELTAARFIPNPFAMPEDEGRKTKDEGADSSFVLRPSSGTRLYKTGDLARWRPDGTLEFLERGDHQVKIRGFRVEVAEVEALLARHPAVRECVVVAREDVPGDKRLVAYVVPTREQGTGNREQEDAGLSTASLSPVTCHLSPGELRSFLAERLPDYMVPAAFVPLAALPRTANGKLDRRALPEPEQERADVESTFVAPRDLVELQLAQVWEQILKVRPIGVTDNFFELGGDSLLAVRLMARIRKQFGQNLPLAALIQGATIAQLAQLLRKQPGAAPRSPLVAIQPSGTKPPFFCVHPSGGNVLCYYNLARLLGADQPFYGLQAPGLYSEQPPYTSVEDMAAHYVAALREMQPDGPYMLGGWSFGGVVAFEMAQQLRRQGHEVALLALLDSTMPVAGNLAVVDDPTLVAWAARDLGRQFGKDLGVDADALRGRALDEQLRYVLERAWSASVLSPDVGVTQMRQLFTVYQTNVHAQLRYQPQRYPGRLISLAASELPAGRTLDSSAGWDELAGEGLVVHQVPGNHYTILQEPHVQALAEWLRVCLDEVQLVLFS